MKIFPTPVVGSIYHHFL